MKKRIRIAVIVVAAIAVVAIIWNVFFAKPFLYAGTVEADEIDISPGVSSKIASYEVAEGDLVQAGQVLVRLSCEDIKILAGQAKIDFDRALRLYRAGSMPQATYDRLKYQHDDADLKASWCEIAAPVSGTVLVTYHEPGEWVRPGVNLLTLADLKSLYAVVYVPQPMLARISPGQKVKGFLPEMPGRVFEGKVAHLREEAEFTPKNVQTAEERARLVYGVKIHFDNPDGVLKPGMTIECKLP